MGQVSGVVGPVSSRAFSSQLFMNAFANAFMNTARVQLPLQLKSSLPRRSQRLYTWLWVRKNVDWWVKSGDGSPGEH